MTNRVYNFGAGPATLPASILYDAQQEFLNWHDLGMSVCEVGHRTEDFIQLLEQAEADLRELLAIPSTYTVMFLGGPARMQFAMLPMNLLAAQQQGAYLISGLWSAMAFEEASKIAKAYCLVSAESMKFKRTPPLDCLQLKPNTAYLYFTPNETVHGVRFHEVPRVGDIPLVADMTSCLLSEPLNINEYGLIFAGAQKNISIAGLTVVIIRNELLSQAVGKVIPTMLDYRTHAIHRSLYATPPTFNCYLAAKMFSWIKTQGGVSVLHEQNRMKAAKLYDYIDQSSFYYCDVEKNSRSLVNICFGTYQRELEAAFVDQAAQEGLVALKGHRAVGGLRASLYNAMPLQGVDALLTFMHRFAENHSR
ncbi:MAG: 3-phosphoserine/phosphohydroxythreonine transaminase [Legionella sp.]